MPMPLWVAERWSSALVYQSSDSSPMGSLLENNLWQKMTEEQYPEM